MKAEVQTIELSGRAIAVMGGSHGQVREFVGCDGFRADMLSSMDRDGRSPWDGQGVLAPSVRPAMPEEAVAFQLRGRRRDGRRRRPCRPADVPRRRARGFRGRTAVIDAALRAAAAFVDDNASTTAWDVHLHLSDEQRFAKAQKIKAVASELWALADASETREVRYAEYGALEDRLYAFGFSMSPKLRQDVAAAIHRARGPAEPQGGEASAPS